MCPVSLVEIRSNGETTHRAGYSGGPRERGHWPSECCTVSPRAIGSNCVHIVVVRGGTHRHSTATLGESRVEKSLDKIYSDDVPICNVCVYTCLCVSFFFLCWRHSLPAEGFDMESLRARWRDHEAHLARRRGRVGSFHAWSGK